MISKIRDKVSVKAAKVVVFLFLTVIAGLLWWDNSKVLAGTYDNAYTFYENYGNRIVFVPSTEEDGNIYYATRAKRTSSNIQFSNIGWEAKVADSQGGIFHIFLLPIHL